ncbi:MAG: hypothetical protein LBI48_02010 [Burkholderiaceae bacterium]|jgi:hypothetical protein|nr:hypothetical protein [Burkholderiaceae bacterium]
MYQSYEDRQGVSQDRLHPTFADALRSLLLIPQQVAQAQAKARAVVDEREYRRKLAAHDWSYQWSDDHSVWERGHAERSELQAMQAAIDPGFAIWNSVAPAEYRRQA